MARITERKNYCLELNCEELQNLRFLLERVSGRISQSMGVTQHTIMEEIEFILDEDIDEEEEEDVSYIIEGLPVPTRIEVIHKMTLPQIDELITAYDLDIDSNITHPGNYRRHVVEKLYEKDFIGEGLDDVDITYRDIMQGDKQILIEAIRTFQLKVTTKLMKKWPSISIKRRIIYELMEANFHHISDIERTVARTRKRREE